MINLKKVLVDVVIDEIIVDEEIGEFVLGMLMVVENLVYCMMFYIVRRFVDFEVFKRVYGLDSDLLDML